MLKRLLLTAAALAFIAPGAVQAQTMVESLKGLSDSAAGNLMATAEMLDEGLYSFRPSDDVRTTGQILAHVANAQYMFCAAVAGESSPNTQNFEETATTKAAIVAALEGAFAYCDGVYAKTTDDVAGNPLTFFGSPNTVAGVLAFNTAHNMEHYGNLVTYMRINGITPPSSM